MATEEDDLCGRLDFHSTTASLYDPFFDLTIFHTAKLTGKIKIYLRTDLPVWFFLCTHTIAGLVEGLYRRSWPACFVTAAKSCAHRSHFPWRAIFQ